MHKYCIKNDVFEQEDITWNRQITFEIDKGTGLNTMVGKPLGCSIMDKDPTRSADQLLIDRIKKREKAAFREIYSRFSQLVFNLVFKVLNDREETEEVVQEVFLQIWNKAGAYDSSRGALSTWIINISRSRSIDRLRKLGKKGYSIDLNEETLSSNYDFSLIIENREERKKVIQEALDSLPEDQRTAIEMVYYQGFTHVETAETLNQPVGTIKTRLRLGVAKLRERIGPYIEDLS